MFSKESNNLNYYMRINNKIQKYLGLDDVLTPNSSKKNKSAFKI